MPMDFMELAQERYSLRSFDPREVEPEKLELILQAGRLAPTAANYQPQKIYVVQSAAGLQQLKTCTPYTFDAPTVLVVCADTSKSWKRKYDGHDSYQVDGAIVATHMMLEATELGLGTTWVASFDPAVLSQILGLPENCIPVCLLPLGYPSPTAQVNPNHYSRKELGETVTWEITE